VASTQSKQGINEGGVEAMLLMWAQVACLEKLEKEHETICRYVPKQSLETQFTHSWRLK
jgi:hypothetical protein